MSETVSETVSESVSESVSNESEPNLHQNYSLSGLKQFSDHLGPGQQIYFCAINSDTSGSEMNQFGFNQNISKPVKYFQPFRAARQPHPPPRSWKNAITRLR